MRATVLTLIAALAMVGCTASPVDPAALDGIDWRLVSANGVRPAPDVEPGIGFGGGGFKAFTGCNVIAGQATIGGDRLIVTRVDVPPSACASPEAQAIDHVFSAMLSSQPVVALVDDRLVLRSSVGEVVFERAEK